MQTRKINQPLELDGKRYIPAARVREQYDISATQLWRHEKSGTFPAVVGFNGKRYFLEDDLLAWVRAQIARPAKRRGRKAEPQQQAA
jgi:predicted DNA-binding transcriptional regulator AlpA